MGKTYIVSRHPGAVAWLKSRGFAGQVIAHLDPKILNRGDRVVGVLPITLVKQLIDKGVQVYSLQLPNLPRELRGEELTPELMDKYEAKVFRILALEWEEVNNA